MEDSESPEFDAALQAVAAAPHVDVGSRARMRLDEATIVDDTFRVESVLGEGAMGVVYLATDLALDRQVALKLRAAPSDHPRSSRMWREAKAMARLAHPNVITVHEVGVHLDRVYIAMELVDGGTLRDWLRAQPRSVDDVLAVFVQAARGLAAAHAVGLVHRDFKPTNVLMGSDGRVRVADFGLARGATDTADGAHASPARASPSPESERSPSVDSKLTATGTAVGTPAYMAPEQQQGGAIDHRADQFAFFVSLHEALFGTRRPGAKRRPSSKRPVATGRVPPWLKTAVLRGLEPDAADRFGDMNAALAALQGDPRRRRRMILIAGGVAIGVAATFGAAELDARRGRARCREQASAIDSAWSDTTRSSIANAFRESDVPFAEPTLARMEPHLDDYVAAWRARYTDACIEAEVDGVRDPALWSASRSCFEERMQELVFLVEAFAVPDSATVQDSVSSAAGLSSLDRCVEDAWLKRHPPRDRSAERYAQLARASALLSAGRYEQGLALAQDVLNQIGDADPALRAEALIRAGELADGTGKIDDAAALLAEGFEEALAIGDDDLALEAATELVYVVGIGQQRYDEGLWWRQAAAGLLRRLGEEDGWNAAALHNNVGMVFEAQAKPEEALAEHQRALEIRVAQRGPSHPFVAYSHNNLGTTYAAQGRNDEAAREMTQAAEILTAALGPEHPQVAIAYNNLGSLYNKQGRFEDAIETHRRALASFKRAFGEEHPQTAISHSNLGGALHQLGRHAEAERELDRAFEIRVSALGPDHPGVATIHNRRGNVYLAQGRTADAEREHARALAIVSEAFGEQHPKTAASHLNLGRVYKVQARDADARSEFEAALESYGDEHPDARKARAELDALQR